MSLANVTTLLTAFGTAWATATPAWHAHHGYLDWSRWDFASEPRAIAFRPELANSLLLRRVERVNTTVVTIETDAAWEYEPPATSGNQSFSLASDSLLAAVTTYHDAVVAAVLAVKGAVLNTEPDEITPWHDEERRAMGILARFSVSL